MQKAVVMLAILAGAGYVFADDADLLNEATLEALETAQTSLEKAPKVGTDINRIGVATFEGDPSNVTDLVKSMMTKTEFNVVLTNDVDWGPLLDEFARQVKRADLMIAETAHELRVQGVDAVLYGAVEKAAVEPVQEGGRQGRRATVRVLLNLASLSEENPGSLLWSEQVTGTAETLEPLPTDARVVTFFQRNRIIGIILIGVVVVVILGMLLRRATRPR